MKSLFPILGFAIALFFQSPAANANAAKQSEILREASLALSNDEFVKAVQQYYAAREHIDADGSIDLSDEDVYQLIQINRSIADAMTRGKFGDPCKPLGKANENLVVLSIRVATERRHPYDRPVSLASRQIQQAIVTNGCSQKIAKTPDPKIAGIYYLRGVMETASGLKLDENGRYEWYLTVGSLDLASKGVWQRRGDHIQLISDQENKDPKIIVDTRKIPFTPQTGETIEDTKLPDNPNYAMIFKSAESDTYPPRAIALFGYADGREKMAGSADSGRFEVKLDAEDVPTSVRLLFYIQEQMIEVRTDIVPEPGFAHEFEVRRPGLREIGVTTMVLHVDGETLRSPMTGQKGAYVKAKPKPKPKSEP